jgi:hypothetical protein
MPTTRNILRLLPHEEELLRTLYRDFNIPTDQYPQRPDDLVRLVTSLNDLTGRTESPPDVLHFMITKRKDGKWEKLGRNAGGNYTPPEVSFTEEDNKHLDSIHEEFQIASDNYALNADAAKRLQDEFARRTGRIVPAMVLAAAMISRRKAGALATLKPKADDHGIGFSDIDKIAN